MRFWETDQAEQVEMNVRILQLLILGIVVFSGCQKIGKINFGKAKANSLTTPPIRVMEGKAILTSKESEWNAEFKSIDQKAAFFSIYFSDSARGWIVADGKVY